MLEEKRADRGVFLKFVRNSGQKDGRLRLHKKRLPAEAREPYERAASESRAVAIGVRAVSGDKRLRFRFAAVERCQRHRRESSTR
jgi:hypothetical protein